MDFLRQKTDKNPYKTIRHMDNPSIARKLKTANRTWIRPFQDGAGTRYQQIARQIVDAVKDGVLLPGDRLPPQRDLAQVMGVDLTTVTRAYAEVRSAGLLDAQGAGGTYIASAAAGVGSTTVDLAMNTPPLLGSAMFARLMQAGMTHVQETQSSGELMSYHVGAGTKADRDAAAAWLQPMLGRVDPERVVICPGAQPTLAALILARTQSGDLIASDGLTYPGLLSAARVLQRSVVPVAADAEGVIPDALDESCKAKPIKLVYLTPTIHNPTTATMSAQRRQDILHVAGKHRLVIVEDDPYWLLAGDAPPPLAAMAGHVPVFYLSTLSKCLAPGLRTAYLVVPRSEPLEPILDALRAINWMPTQSMASMASYWIRSGQAQDLLQKIRGETGQRQKLAQRILNGQASAHPHGLHLWLALPPRLDQYRLIQTAREQGLGVTSSDVFGVEEAMPQSIRVSLGGAADQPSLKGALERFADILATDAPYRRSVVV